jgi:hypothetical protein
MLFTFVKGQPLWRGWALKFGCFNFDRCDVIIFYGRIFQLIIHSVVQLLTPNPGTRGWVGDWHVTCFGDGLSPRHLKGADLEKP